MRVQTLGRSLTLGFLLLLSWVAHSYPEFIGYGYTSCVTCHFNTQGNGPLNDYGRALFASEISARDVFDENTSDDDLGQASGFLGKTELPWWLRPSAKYRTLWFNSNPGSSQNTKALYLMQEEAYLTVLLDKEQKWLVSAGLSHVRVTSGGPVTNPNDDHPYQVWTSREAYVRWQARKELFISAGMLEKVFGLRDADHTQFNRVQTQLGQYQSTVGTLTHGAVIQWSTKEHEYTLNPFVGNLFESNALRAQGASFMAEYNTGEKSRTGLGLLYQKTPSQVEQAVELHEKLGLSVGSALLIEAGLAQIQDAPTHTNTSSIYAVAETWVQLRRGYNWVTDLEYDKSKTDVGDNPDLYRFGFGLLCFPLPRVEVRLTATDGRTWEATNGDRDSWSLIGQLHLSL